MKHLISPKAAAALEYESLPGSFTNILTCKVYAHADGEQQIIVSGDPQLRAGIVLARIPQMGNYDVERILAGNIAHAMNLERGQL